MGAKLAKDDALREEGQRKNETVYIFDNDNELEIEIQFTTV